MTHWQSTVVSHTWAWRIFRCGLPLDAGGVKRDDSQVWLHLLQGVDTVLGAIVRANTIGAKYAEYGVSV